jgi:hypothetical protein
MIEIERIGEAYVELVGEPAAPAPWCAGTFRLPDPRGCSAEQFYGATESLFAEAARTFKLRAPTKETSLIPIIAVGDSMPGIAEHGDICYFDPHLPAQDGDLVLAHITDSCLRTFHEMVAKGDETARATYCRNYVREGRQSNTMIKLLRHGADGRLYLQYIDGAFAIKPGHPFYGHRILGVCRHIQRQRRGSFLSRIRAALRLG